MSLSGLKNDFQPISKEKLIENITMFYLSMKNRDLTWILSPMLVCVSKGESNSFKVPEGSSPVFSILMQAPYLDPLLCVS